MPDHALRNYLAQSSPWLTLHDLQQEVKELRDMIERMPLAPIGAGIPEPLSQPSAEQQQSIVRQLAILEQRVESLQWWGKLFNVQVAPQRVLLADAKRVERVNEDERVAGLLLALCTLFIGAWLETLMTGPFAVAFTLLATTCFLGLAVFFYRRSHKSWQELHEEGLLPVWPPQERDGERRGEA